MGEGQRGWEMAARNAGETTSSLVPAPIFIWRVSPLLACAEAVVKCQVASNAWYGAGDVRVNRFVSWKI